MKALDRFLQSWRMNVAQRHVPKNARVIDVGAHEGEFFARLGDRLAEGFGIEPLAKREQRGPRWQVRPGYFPAVCPADGGWDVLTMLAVLEHVPAADQRAVVEAAHRLLKPGGRVIVTVPGPIVDHMLAVLRWFRLVDGMSLEEHYGFKPANTPQLFAEPRFRARSNHRFQLGANHLFVFERR